ncbi:hypothetical protein PMY12_18600 [Clostridium tertium]|uniref:Uncharacterized protein n=1 Tax=Clostridium tertium TaxID=1559 RepID=A0A9X3XNZ3_9CLOT|nr:MULTISPECIES: hypothetical protein [Clostridium]MDB1935260.1 hypothetical protein [Clostridium tertium]MDB1939020.1 hypothetical protein [Clostridium tertium]MDC4242578.1 hypothetical protein [Clostridium tertium]MDU7947801.1 hypothetical protein [Clostridium sp.]
MASGIKITGMKELEKALKDMQKHPEKLFEKGDVIDINCPNCSKETKAVFIKESYVRCKKCNETIKVDFVSK